MDVCCHWRDVEEFNSQLLTPELSNQQLTDLHRQLSELYHMYIDPASPDCIRLDDDIIAQLKTGASLSYHLCSPVWTRGDILIQLSPFPYQES